MPSERVPFTPSSILFRPHQKQPCNSVFRRAKSRIAACGGKANLIAPRYERFITMSIYRHSWPKPALQYSDFTAHCKGAEQELDEKHQVSHAPGRRHRLSPYPSGPRSGRAPRGRGFRSAARSRPCAAQQPELQILHPGRAVRANGGRCKTASPWSTRGKPPCYRWSGAGTGRRTEAPLRWFRRSGSLAEKASMDFLQDAPFGGHVE